MAMSVYAWDALYIVGSGTPGGFDLSKAIPMAGKGDFGWVAVCPLYNGYDGDVKKSFRLQEQKNGNLTNITARKQPVLPLV